MSISASLSSALTGLNVAQEALRVVSNNVANVNTDGYSRKVVRQEAMVLASQGSGARVSEAERITDRFLVREVQRQEPVLGEREVVSRYHALLQDYLGAPGSNVDLGSQIAELGAALEGFSSDPETLAISREVVTAADRLVDSIDSLVDGVQRLRNDADQEISNSVAGINSKLQGIADANREVVRLAHLGQTNPDLLDRRDQLVTELGRMIQIGTYQMDDGGIAIYGAGGQALLDISPRVLVYDSPSLVANETVLQPIRIFTSNQIDPANGAPLPGASGVELVSQGVRAELSAELANDATPDSDQLIVSRVGGGRLQGLLEIRDRVLPGLHDQLQELASGLQHALNAVHNDGVAWPPPASLAGSRTDLAGFAGATRSGTATIAVIDQATGNTLQAFQIDLGAVTDETDLVSQINTGLGAYGGAAIGADGNLTLTLSGSGRGLAIAEGDSQVQVTDAAGRQRSFGFSHYFGLNDLLVSTGGLASNLAVRADLRTDPAQLAAAKLDVTTGPLVAQLGGTGDNRGAQALAEALRADHSFIARGGLAATSASLNSYAGTILENASARAGEAEDALSRDQALHDALTFKAAAISGVNLDEEMSNLIQLQQAYSVAARVVTVIDEMMDTLVQAFS